MLAPWGDVISITPVGSLGMPRSARVGLRAWARPRRPRRRVEVRNFMLADDPKFWGGVGGVGCKNREKEEEGGGRENWGLNILVNHEK